jgi:hypothetical protein
MPNTTDTGWVTFTTFRLYGRLMLVQKNDGCTRTVPARCPGTEAPRRRVTAPRLGRPLQGGAT